MNLTEEAIDLACFVIVVSFFVALCLVWGM
jgi:hypothetical protein